MGETCFPHHVITPSPNEEHQHWGRSSVLELHDLARWPGLPPDGRPPHLRHLGLGCSMMMIMLPASGRRLWNTLRRTPSCRTRPLDGAQRVYASSEHKRREQSLSMACATSRSRRVPRPTPSKRPSSSEGVRGLSQLGRVVVYEAEKPQGRQKSLDGVRAVS